MNKENLKINVVCSNCDNEYSLINPKIFKKKVVYENVRLMWCHFDYPRDFNLFENKRELVKKGWFKNEYKISKRYLLGDVTSEVHYIKCPICGKDKVIYEKELSYENTKFGEWEEY